MEAAARAAGVPLETVRLRRPDLLGLYERNLLLVRPDQHVAWRGDALPQDIEGLLRHVTGRGGNEEADPQDFQGSIVRSEEHTSELQSLMRISYAVFCLKNKKT